MPRNPPEARPHPRRRRIVHRDKSSPAHLVFEIGTEEMPPQAAWDGARQLAASAVTAFTTARLPVKDVRAYSTPRRLVLMASGLAPRQDDAVREIRGPAARVAFTPEGRSTAAAQGFARAQGVPVASLERRATSQGEYVFALRREHGRPTVRVLAELLPVLAGELAFPRAMRWTAGPVRFARPVRWVLTLLGRDVVPCAFAGIRAGRHTFGHRIMHPQAVRVPNAEVFRDVLRRSSVLLDPNERRRRIVRGVARAARGAGGRPILDAGMLEESVQLVEWPEAFAGRFAPEFLTLPREVLITVMQHHQKYFAVEDASGRLLPAFVALRNGGKGGLPIVREGNEWVLRARLADARFFFEEDRKRPLATRVDDLQGLLFHEKLGTMADKRRRLEALTGRLAEMVRLGRESASHLARAAHLSKADLVTQVVRELPELQGTMGAIYARLDGEPEPVSAAIGEQYLPSGSVLPRSQTGAYLALLDKMDTLLGGLAAGLAPTGSEDPYGLRRAAQGIVAIVLDRGLALNIRDLALAALDAHGISDPATRERVANDALGLLRQRLRGTLIDSGVSYDTVDAALAAGGDNLTEAAARARALWAFRHRPEFARVYTAFDRAARIVPPGFQGQAQPDGLGHAAERALLEAVALTRPDVDAAVREGRYDEALNALSRLADPVDRFFTDVLVMADDERIRTNRLALLRDVADLVRRIADLSRVVVGEGKAPAGS